MKNITVSVDEETYRLSCVRAARLGTSVSALVRGYMKSLAHGKGDGREVDDGSEAAECDHRRSLLNKVFADFEARGVGLHMSNNLSREALYDRDAPR